MARIYWPSLSGCKYQLAPIRLSSLHMVVNCSSSVILPYTLPVTRESILPHSFAQLTYRSKLTNRRIEITLRSEIQKENVYVLVDLLFPHSDETSPTGGCLKMSVSDTIGPFLLTLIDA